MSYEQTAMALLRKRALLNHKPVQTACWHVSKCLSDVEKAEGFMDTLRAADALSLAAEALADAAKALHAETDAALVEALDTTGCPGIRTEHHNVTTRRNPAVVDIVDRAAVPSEFMAQPEPYPDKALIRKHLLMHDVNWAVLRQSGVGLQRRRIDQ